MKSESEKNAGELRQGIAKKSVRISLTDFFWFGRICYTLGLVNFDSTANTPSVPSFSVNQKDGARSLRAILRKANCVLSLTTVCKVSLILKR